MQVSTLRVLAISAGLLIVFPALSAAQGYRIAFVSGRIGEQAIYVMDADGSNVKCLTGCNRPVDVAPSRHRFELLSLMDGVWSPDGQRLTFYGARQEDSDIASKYNIPFHFPLYIIGANGAGLKRLLDVPVVLGVRWSPDGKRLLFASAYEDPHRNDPEVRRGHTQTLRTALYILDLATATSKRITTVAETDTLAFPSWSPDGTKVVFTCGTAPHQPREICIVNVDGTHEQQLTTPGGNGVMPTWSSDGRHIAFVDSSRIPPDQGGGIYVMEADGTNQKRVSKLRSPSVSWSPDGKSIMIRVSGDVYIVNVQGNYATKLSLGSTCWNQVFSPDGRSVIYECNEGVERKNKIYAINVDGTDRRRLSDDTLEGSNPFAVSPLLSQ